MNFMRVSLWMAKDVLGALLWRDIVRLFAADAPSIVGCDIPRHHTFLENSCLMMFLVIQGLKPGEKAAALPRGNVDIPAGHAHSCILAVLQTHMSTPHDQYGDCRSTFLSCVPSHFCKQKLPQVFCKKMELNSSTRATALSNSWGRCAVVKPASTSEYGQNDVS
jgi:hypothetical protein